MADAVHREDNDIGATAQSGKPLHALVDAAIMADEPSIAGFDQAAQDRKMLLPPADVQNASAFEVQRWFLAAIDVVELPAAR